MSRRQRHRRATFWTAVTVCLMAASCVMSVVNRKRDQRPQAWDAQRGPTVPHDTFPADCALCHVSENWHTLRSDFTFDHAAQAGLELNGAHARAQCLRCRNDRGPVELFAQRGCSGCHSDPHQGQLSSNCAQCHNERNWAADRQFAQHARTRFPLIGAHVGVACFRCHPGAQANNFKRADVHCVSCHGSDLERATNPDHAALSWTDNCQKCHTPVEWGSGGFVHNVFPLTGGHQVVACNACHTSGQFTGLSQSCSSCHLDEFQATTNPNHITAGFSQNCQDCHSTAGWGGAGFLHNAFPLTGGHQAVACTACHANGQYSGLSQTCSDCHVDDFQATTNPNHSTAGFGQNCQDCHSTVAWGGAGFVHDRFPLTGAHQAATCAACHPTGQFAGTPQSCSDCHLSDFQSADNPNHVATGFSQQCQDCHSTIAWRGATFAHNRFPLTGAHETATCAACHTTGQYAGTPQACSACHLTEYQTAVNPNHAGVGFPLDCEQCHSTTTWQGATFAHQFNIASGPHRVYDCSECHRVPGSVHVVSCTHCHEHGQASAGEEHQGEPGYVWDSNACIGCHPTGRH